MNFLINLLIILNLNSQTPLINSVKQIDEKVKDAIVKTSPEIIKINNKLNDLSQSTQTLSFQLNNEIQERVSNDSLLQNQINSLNLSTQSLQQQINNIQISTDTLSQYFVKKYGGDIIYDGLTSQGLFIANNGIQAYNNILLQGITNINGNLNIDGTLKFTNGSEGEGKVLMSDSQGNASWQEIIKTTYPFIFQGHFNLGDLDAYQRPRLWFYDEGAVMKLGGATSDGDGINRNSEGIVVIGNNVQDMARIKADRIGLTSAQDSSLYYFRVDKDKLFYKDTSLNDIFRIDRTTKKLTYKDGTQGAGKILVSDDNGVASWQEINISGDNLGNHVATQDLNMNGNRIFSEYINQSDYQRSDILLQTDSIYIYSTMRDGDNIKSVELALIPYYNYLTINLSESDNESEFSVTRSGLSFTKNNEAIFEIADDVFFTNSLNNTFSGIVNIGTNPNIIYICQGGTLDGMLTINTNQCINAGGTAIQTKLRLGE